MPDSRKVLIITYYWPPSGGGGVQRWLKIAKYLPKHGWTPVIYTPENPQFENRDDSLLEDVSSEIKVYTSPIKEPYELVNRLMFWKKRSFKQGVVSEKSKSSPLERLITWARGNLFVPDPKRSWVLPSVPIIKQIIEKEQVSAIITTGPPHSMHLIGLKVKSLVNVPWLADFRDPWSDWDILDLLHLSKRVRTMHQRLEQETVERADSVLTVSPSWAANLKEKYQKEVHVITNGFDHTDFDSLKAGRQEEFRLLHAGLLNSFRNNQLLWEVLEGLLQDNEEFSGKFKLILAGNVNKEIIEKLRKFPALNSKTIEIGYLSHADLFAEYEKASAMLLLQNSTKNSKGHIPAKFFEYLATGKPIVAIGDPDSDLANLLKEYNALQMSSGNDTAQIKEQLETLFNSFLEGHQINQPKSPADFSRETLTKSLAKLLNSITSTESQG